MITLKRVEDICTRFSGLRILVVGDIILDRYIFGDVRRISPEAPVPVVTVVREEDRLGGAGNVATNIDSLGARGVLLGVCGKDAFAHRLKLLKTEDNLMVEDSGNRTIVKTRIIAGKQHIIRLDREESFRLDEGLLQNVLQKIVQVSEEADGIIVSDYAKGTVVRPVMDMLRNTAARRRIPLVVDPKPSHRSLYRGVTGVTPNLHEAEDLSGGKLVNERDIGRALLRIRKRLKTEFVVITRGAEGISACQQGMRQFHLPAFSHEVYDVTGAGDTVTAVLTLVMVAGGSLREAVAMANGAASLVVEKVGTYQVTVPELIERMRFLKRRH